MQATILGGVSFEGIMEKVSALTARVEKHGYHKYSTSIINEAKIIKTHVEHAMKKPLFDDTFLMVKDVIDIILKEAVENKK